MIMERKTETISFTTPRTFAPASTSPQTLGHHFGLRVKLDIGLNKKKYIL